MRISSSKNLLLVRIAKVKKFLKILVLRFFEDYEQ